MALNREVIIFKLRAVGIHLIISGGILAVTVAWFWFVWFPGIAFQIEGGWDGTKIMAAVDLVLGPVISLVIFHPLKSRRAIVFDVVIVATIQASALVAGIYSISTQRPLAFSLDYENNRFVTIRAEDFVEQDDEPEALLKFGDRFPVWTAPKVSRTSEEKNSVRVFEALAGLSAAHLYFLLQPLDDARFKIPEAASTPETLESGYSNNSSGQLNPNLIWVRLDGRYGVGAYGFDNNGTLVDQAVLSRF